ncbi:glycosyltransferase family 87 protein [Halovulum sp. GXIMD14793]
MTIIKQRQRTMISPMLPSTPAELRRARLVDGAIYAAALIGLVWYAVSIMRGAFPVDLAAVYYAGQFFANGAYDLVYWEDWAAYPEAWMTAIRQDGYDKPAYAFIYPPVWAALISPIASRLQPETFFLLFTVIHMLAYGATIRLIRDLFNNRICLSLWAIPVMAILPITMVGGALIGFGQPTALLYLMIVLGFRALIEGRHGRAGLWLALAATLKIFPVILGVIFLTRRFRAGLLPFAATGLSMVGLSLLLAPIALHTDFVQIGRQVNEITMISYLNLNLEGVLARLHLLISGQDQTGVYSIPDLTWVTCLTILASLSFALWLYRAARLASPLELRQKVMPTAILLMTLTAPLAWTHYFTIALALLPGLFVVQSPRVATLATLAILLCNLPLTYVTLDVPWYPIVGFVSMLALALLFLTAANEETHPKTVLP